jgi:hypothetical protein
MRSLAIENYRRSELERRIEQLIELCDLLDGDPDFEDGGDSDWSGYEEELPIRQWSGDGVTKALRLIETSLATSKRADE